MVEGLTKVFYPPASNTVIFVVMAMVLLIKPAGLFGQTQMRRSRDRSSPIAGRGRRRCAAPWFVYPVFLMKALCFALFACAFNLLLGYAGLMSFGHAMFFGMAAYFFGHAVKVWGWPMELGLLAGVLGAAVLGLVTGALAIRRQGIYFAMITLAFAQMVYFLCVQMPFTGGEDGLQGIPRKPLLRPDPDRERLRRCTTSCWRSSCSASARSTASSIRRSARC